MNRVLVCMVARVLVCMVARVLVCMVARHNKAKVFRLVG